MPETAAGLQRAVPSASSPEVRGPWSKQHAVSMPPAEDAYCEASRSGTYIPTSTV